MHRRHELRATKILQEKTAGRARIKFLWDSTVEEIIGDNFVKQIKLRNVNTGEETAVDVSGVFVSVGSQPATGYLKGAADSGCGRRHRYQ